MAQLNSHFGMLTAHPGALRLHFGALEVHSCVQGGGPGLHFEAPVRPMSKFFRSGSDFFELVNTWEKPRFPEVSARISKVRRSLRCNQNLPKPSFKVQQSVSGLDGLAILAGLVG